MAATVRGRLVGVNVGNNFSTSGVNVRIRKRGSTLAALVTDAEPAQFAEAEARLELIADAIQLHHHQVNGLGITRTNFPYSHSSNIGMSSAVLDSNRIAATVSELETHPRRIAYGAVLKVLRRADRESAWLDQMVPKWMAFNTLYGMLAAPGQGRERTQITNFVQNVQFTDAELKPWIDKTIAQGSFQFLIQGGLLVGVGTAPTNVSNELSLSIASIGSSGDYRSLMTNALLAVYAVRNLFFHGSTPALPGQRREQLSESVNILDFIVRATIQKEFSLPVVGPASNLIEFIRIGFTEGIGMSD